MPQISIIIPVYNAEKHIGKCIESIISQTFCDFEAIIINDGSTDSSLDICQSYAKKDSRIIIKHQKNGGASSARNKGLEIASGNWITFIDADDYVDKEYIEKLYRHIEQENEQSLIIQGLKKIAGNKEIAKSEFRKTILTGKGIEKAFDEMEIFKCGYTVAKLYNKNVIDKYKIKFNIDISYSEDLLFMLEYILHSTTIKFIEGTHYNYVIDASTLSRHYYSFEKEYALYKYYIKSIFNISEKFSFTMPENALKNGGLMIMRSLYSMYINKYDRKTRINNILQIRKQHKHFIQEYYKPQIFLFKIIKFTFLLHPIVFDTICNIKFK